MNFILIKRKSLWENILRRSNRNCRKPLCEILGPDKDSCCCQKMYIYKVVSRFNFIFSVFYFNTKSYATDYIFMLTRLMPWSLNLARSELFSIHFRLPVSLARRLATKFLLLRSPVYTVTKYQQNPD